MPRVPSELHRSVRRGEAPTRGAVLYDFLLCRGGAERVTLELATGLPGTDVCVAFRRPDVFAAEFPKLNLIELGRSPRFAAPGLRALTGYALFSHRTAFVANYDWVVFSGSTAPIAVHHRPIGGNIYYCHTLPRFAYDLSQYYMENLPAWRRPLFKQFCRHVRRYYEAAIRRMDVLVANSENVRRRIQRFLDRDARVVYPPCDTGGYRWLGQDGYYVSTARLERYKRVDLVVTAFRRMPDKRLVVASGGSELASLKRLAGDARNISFVGWQETRQLQELVGRAVATIYVARDEDFGMSPVESMAAGKPVIGVAEGGLLETVIPARTGVLLPAAPTEDDVIAAVNAMPAGRAAGMRRDCEERARLFGRERFFIGMRACIHAAKSVRSSRAR